MQCECFKNCYLSDQTRTVVLEAWKSILAHTVWHTVCLNPFSLNLLSPRIARDNVTSYPPLWKYFRLVRLNLLWLGNIRPKCSAFYTPSNALFITSSSIFITEEVLTCMSRIWTCIFGNAGLPVKLLSHWVWCHDNLTHLQYFNSISESSSEKHEWKISWFSNTANVNRNTIDSSGIWTFDLVWSLLHFTNTCTFTQSILLSIILNTLIILIPTQRLSLDE